MISVGSSVSAQIHVENVQSKEAVLQQLIANNIFIRNVRSNIVFGYYLSNKGDHDEVSYFESGPHPKHICFILPTSEDAISVVNEYITKHRVCFTEPIDFIKAIYVKSKEAYNLGIHESVGIRPIKVCKIAPILLDRYYEYRMLIQDGHPQCIYLDLHGRDFAAISNECNDLLRKSIMADIKLGREVFFKLVQRAISVSESEIVISETLRIVFDVQVSKMDSSTSYAAIYFRNDTFVAETDKEMYDIFNRISHLIE